MRQLRFLITLALAAAALSSARADVIFQGKVEFWDRISNTYRPAQQVHVEIEGDWWEPDLHVDTNDQGNYYKRFRDPHWGDFDGVDIEVYAETRDLLEVKEAWYQLWPYHATSPERNNVNGGDTVTINLKIGGPQNNGSPYYKSIAETANAFIVHQEMLAHYRRLRSMGWPSSTLDDKTVIVPAAGVNSYYNHLTENINLVINGPNTGYINWTNIPTGNANYMAYPNFKVTCRHELSHAIHDDITFAFLIGLNSPSTHSLEGTYSETNRWIAYTEGWAAFLPAATLNISGKFESSQAPPGFNLSDGGDHYAMEAEVAGILWDLFDPIGNEPLRKPATKTYDNAHSLPAEVISQQTWRDRISDPTLSRIRNIASQGMDTIAEFLESYRSTYSSDLHAVKSIALNRSITNSVPPETPAHLVGTPTLTRSGDVVTVNLSVRELDPEDRNFVKLSFWHQRGTSAPTLRTETTLSSGWTSNTLATTVKVSIPSGSGTPELLWLVVNDDMRPTAYRLEIPAPLPFRLQRFRPEMILKAQTTEETSPFVSRLRFNSAMLRSFERPVTGMASRGAEQDGPPSPEEAARIKALKEAIRQARSEVRAYAERKKDSLQAEKMLFKIGAAHGGLPNPVRPAFNKPAPRTGPGQPREAPAQDSAARRALRQWIGDLAGGKPLPRPLTPEAKRDILPYRERLQKHAREHQNAAARAQQLGQQLDSALSAATTRARGVGGQEMEKQLVDGARQTVEQLKRALQEGAADTELGQSLQRQAAAIETVSK